jgi:hypothetical protein
LDRHKVIIVYGGSVLILEGGLIHAYEEIAAAVALNNGPHIAVGIGFVRLGGFRRLPVHADPSANS